MTSTRQRTGNRRRTGPQLPPAFAADADISNLRLVVAWRTAARLHLRQAPIKRTVQRALTDSARRTLETIHQRKVLAYNAEITMTADECALAGPAHLDPDSLVVHELSQLHYPNAETDDLERDFQFFAYLAGPPGAELVFITKFNPRRGLRRKRILRWVDEELTELDEPVLAFDPERVDLVWSPPGDMVILDLNVFEFLLRDAPEIIAKVPNRVRQLAQSLPFASGSEQALSQAALADTRLRRRLSAIVERGHLAGATIDDVERALRRFGYQAGDFVNSGELVVSSANASTVLQVLNEDVLVGEFFGTRFAAERKTQT